MIVKLKLKVIIIVVVILLGIGILSPYIRLYMDINTYKYGKGYIVFDREELIRLDMESKESIDVYTGKLYAPLSITNVNYYEDLNQLAFGIVSTGNSFADMQISFLDEEGKSTGQIYSQGSKNYYNKTMEKLNILLDNPLEEGVTYKVLVEEKEGIQYGYISFTK